mgnify:CR=1 FL=1
MLYGGDEDFTVANFLGLGRVDNCLDCGIDLVIIQHHFDFHLWQEIDDILSTAIKFGVALLATETFNFDNAKALNPNVLQRLFRSRSMRGHDDGFDLFHGLPLTLRAQLSFDEVISSAPAYVQRRAGGKMGRPQYLPRGDAILSRLRKK